MSEAITNTIAAHGRPGLVRCLDLWFPDGGVIFKADNVLFKVYTGLLVAHSPFFKDMLSLPQPENAERYDGVPVVEMTESARDVRSFLLAQQNPLCVCS